MSKRALYALIITVATDYVIVTGTALTTVTTASGQAVTDMSWAAIVTASIGGLVAAARKLQSAIAPSLADMPPSSQ